MTWHPVAPPCDHCGEFCDTTCVSFRADGLVAIEGNCAKCHKLSYITFPAEVAFKKCQSLDDPNDADFDLESWTPKGKAN